jgi:single-stranded-DNA-specific exonuclease
MARVSVLASRWSCSPYSVEAAEDVARELGLSPTVGAILARRGYETADSARRFLTSDDRHDPSLVPGAEAACRTILEHVERGTRIVVHGDYDVDGVCSTTILVEALRALGADPAWHIPGRADGYGLSQDTVDRLAAQGCGLLVTADCAVTAVAEVESAMARGVDVVVTDHHRAGERLPPCTVVHPALGGYPFPELCAAGVAHKLSAVLRAGAGLDPGGADEELDLVALATICDLVPLRGENRRLVREGLRALARTARPGLRALMRVTALDEGSIDERAVGFRLGPRLNAAGRLRHAETALELLLTRDEARAAEVADDLDLLNHERRDAETRALFGAEAARAGQEHEPVYVLAGEGWHPGVVGIVASRICERHHRPCLVVSTGDDGGRGSGRSIPAFDLHAALVACSGHLRRFGGHRAAAGIEIDPERIEPFRRALVAHARAALRPADLMPTRQVDAVVPATALGLDLAEELTRLGPFGHGNPEPTLLVPGATLASVRGMGEESQHARFTLVGGGARAQAVAFRTAPGSLRGAGGAPCDVAVSLELHEWSSVVEPRLVLRGVCPREGDAGCRLLGEWYDLWDAVAAELGADDPGLPPPSRPPHDPVSVAGDSDGPPRRVRDRRGTPIGALAADLVSSGEGVLIVCADTRRRSEVVGRVVSGATGAIRAAADERCQEVDPSPGLTSWSALERNPSLAADYRHVLAIDPPLDPSAIERVQGTPPPAGGGVLHLAWGRVEAEFALALGESELELRPALTAFYRGLREAGGASGAHLAALLRGDGAHGRSPEACARILRVLSELGLVECRPAEGGYECRLLSAEPTALESSGAYRAYRERLEAARACLRSAQDGRAVPHGAAGAG